MAAITNLNADCLNIPLCRVTTYKKRGAGALPSIKRMTYFIFLTSAQKSTNNKKNKTYRILIYHSRHKHTIHSRFNFLQDCRNIMNLSMKLFTRHILKTVLHIVNSLSESAGKVFLSFVH
jgi:hypothetical protein